MTNNIMKSDSKCEVLVEVTFVKEEKYIVAYCPALQLTGYGYTEEEAKKSFETELDIFLEETTKRGSLEKYLLENGWILQRVPKFSYKPPRTKISTVGIMLKQEQFAIPVC